MKFKIKIVVGAVFGLLLLSLPILVVAGLGNDLGLTSENTPEVADGSGDQFTQTVLQWKSKVEEECKKNDIPDEVNTILAIIACESGGDADKTPDIMQCSESQGNAPNTIKDPNQSIEVGVKYYASMFNKHKTDRLNIVQAYNYGGGFLSNCGGKYDLDVAIAFAYSKSGGSKTTYSNPIAKELGYDWRYGYGNMFYAQLVNKYLISENGSGGAANTAIMKLAEQQIGNEGGKKFWSWYGFDSRVEWCACFVSWCANQTKAPIEKFAYCPTGISNFKAKNKWLGAGKVPKEGYVIFFDWGGDGVSDHVGLVKSCDGKTVTTIEGNSNDSVRQNSYSVDSKNICGYGYW
jgi:hypothetical protein